MESHLFIKLYCLFTIQFLKLLVTDCFVVVSPLVNLMKDQVDKLANLGILAASLSEITEENAGCCGRKNFNRTSGSENISTGDDFRCFAVCDWLYLS